MDEKAAELILLNFWGVDIIRHYSIVQASALILLVVTVIITVYQYYRYQRIKRLYRADYAKAICLKDIGRLLPLMPKHKSRRYCKAEGLIADAGLGISVESFYLAKTLLFAIGFVFFVSIQTTNAFIQYDSIINDLNIEKTFIDMTVKPDSEKLQQEREMFKYVDALLPGDKASLKELTKKENVKVYTEYIAEGIKSRWASAVKEDEAIAGRMYRKLLMIRTIEENRLVYFTALAAALFLYFVPNLIGIVKLKLIEDKRDLEVLNYIYVFSIFGRMPPHTIKNVLSNILVVSDIYKPIINEALNGIKSGNGEAVFGSLLQKVRNEKLYELLEVMRLSMNTGLLGLVDNIDEMAVNELKWLEIKSIKRRKSKQVIAMVPVVLVMLMAVIYFSYSLSILSNPMNFIK